MGHRRGMRGAAAVVVVAAVLLVGAVGAGAGTPPTLERITAQSKPGVVMIQSLYQAQVVVPVPQVSDAALEQVKNRVILEVVSGQLANDQVAIQNRILEIILADPFSFILAGRQTRTTEAHVGMTGSGAFITPDGYILTAAHVVSVPAEVLKQRLAEKALTKLIKQDLDEFVSELGGNVREDLVQKFQQVLVTFYVNTMQMSNISKSQVALMGSAIPGVELVKKGLPVDVTNAIGEGWPGKDVAIIKVNGKNFPTMPMGDDATVNDGATLHVLGYPGPVAFDAALSDQTQLEPSLTSGVVSARKQTQAGYSALVVDATSFGGNSGGPVIDASGSIVGILAAGPGDDPNAAPQVSYVVPASIAKEFLQRANVTASQGLFSKLYGQALDQYDVAHYKNAVKIFTQINDIAPGNPYVQAMMSKAQALIAQGKDRSSSPVLLFVAVGAGLLALLGGGGAFFFTRRRRRPVALRRVPIQAGPILEVEASDRPEIPAAAESGEATSSDESSSESAPGSGDGITRIA